MKKILIVEDDQFLANAYRLKFAKSDFEVKLAADGQMALDDLANFTPDVILLDLVMPVMDGFTTLTHLRAEPKWANIPVIITSNLGQAEDIAAVRKLGITDYIIKSDVDLNQLVAKINQLLNHSAV